MKLIDLLEDEMSDLEKVRNDPYVIRHIKNPSLEVQLAAVRQDGYAIMYIKNPSEKVQIVAIMQNPDAIKYIKEPTRNAINVHFIYDDKRKFEK